MAGAVSGRFGNQADRVRNYSRRGCERGGRAACELGEMVRGGWGYATLRTEFYNSSLDSAFATRNGVRFGRWGS